MIKLKHIFTIICLLISISGYSQRQIKVNKAYLSNPVDIKKPVLMDSINLKGEKFEYKTLLNTSISIPKQAKFTEEVLAEVARDYFFFPKAREEARIHFLSFNVTADTYIKPKIKITSPGLFELYVNDKKELTKSTSQDSLKAAKMLDKELTLLPGNTTNVIIKYLCLPSNTSIPEGVKIAFELPQKDSLTDLRITNPANHNIQIEDVLKGTRITGTKISPNGQYILVSYRAVKDDGKSDTYTELINTKNNTRSFLGHKRASWMPRTNKFYYTANRQGNLQLIVTDPETFTENILVENIPTGNFYFDYTEQSLYFTDKEANDTRKGDLKLLASPEDRQSGYYDRYFIYKYNINNGLKERLTFGKHSTILNDISSDSRYLLFSVTEEKVTESPFRTTSMFRLDMQAMKLDTLWLNDPYVSSAQFSPDGKQVLILGSPNSFNGIGLNVKIGQIANNYDTQAFIMDVSSKNITPITKSFNPSINRVIWNDQDNMIYMSVADKDYERVYKHNPQNKSFTLLDLPEDIIRSFSVSSSSLMASYIGTSVSIPAKAYIVDLKTNKSTVIDNTVGNNLSSLNLGEVKNWNFTSSDGTEITGRYYLPPNFNSSRKYPMIVYYYGGTTPTPRTFDFPYPMHVYASMGYVVYVIQPSGATGFGQEFSARHVNAWGKRTADDIIEGTKQFLSEHSFIDNTKIGCIGASYGGFMSMYLQTQTDIFAAAVSHAGISSISSYWGEGYWGYTYSSAASVGSYPWNNKELYVDQSPLFNADKIHTPLLLLHGTVDTNVPIGESIQMYTALKILGRPVEFIQVNGENHGVSDYKKRIAWNYSIYAWFEKWLKGDSSWWDNLYPQK